MNPLSRVRAHARTFLTALLLSVALVRPAAAVDWTDIWWAVPEVGWGVNFVQSDKFIFATFYLHDANLQPDWYTGQMTVDTTTGVWSGPLYRTTGSYFGAPWNGNQTNTQEVGSVRFTPSSSYAGTLTWNVGAVNVTKQITRLTLTTIPLGGQYKGAVVAVVTGCTVASDNGTYRIFADFAVTQAASGQLALDIATNGGGTCRMSGDYVQDGQLYRIPGAAYTCGGQFASTSNVSQMKATGQGIEGQWSADVGGGCIESGYFSAVLN